jgi:hypothetical protein
MVLLVFSSGCTGDLKNKTSFGNESTGSRVTTVPTGTLVTTIPTGTESTEIPVETLTPGKTITITPAKTTPSGTSNTCFGGSSENCALYDKCYNGCTKDNSPDTCAKLCCHVKCMNVATKDQKACADVCLGIQPPPTTPEPLATLETPETLATLETPETLATLGPR